MSHIEKHLRLARGPHTKFKVLTLGIVLSVGMVGVTTPSASAANGFNQYGYNYGARIFSGLADGVDNSLDGTVSGDATYANDHLLMKWNAAWDACNAHGYDNPTYCAGAWTTNEWNGMIPGGSQTTDHYKMIWVGSQGVDSTYYVAGGYFVWGNYEVILDQGMALGHVHSWWALATPNGLGASK